MKEGVKRKRGKGSRAVIKRKKKTTSEQKTQNSLTLISKKDFAERCNLSAGNLSNYIKRNNVIVTDGKIDISLPDNIEFLGERKRKLYKSDQKGSLETQLKLIEIEKKKRETRLLELKEQKTLGILIPTELVKLIFAQHTKSILTSFDNSIDRVLTKISKVKKLTSGERSKFRGELKSELNTAVDRSIRESKRNIKKMVQDYTEVRGRGEQK